VISTEEEVERIDKTNYYLDLAETVLTRGTCLRRNHGAVIVKNDELVSSGYAGAPRKTRNCTDSGFCLREKLGAKRGERYELCRSVHAEMNAIISASRRDMMGATLYLVGKDAKNGEYAENTEPCVICRRLIINAGIETVIIRTDKSGFRIIDVHKDYIINDAALSQTIEWGEKK
jgi:dCMP deaminase